MIKSVFEKLVKCFDQLYDAMSAKTTWKCLTVAAKNDMQRGGGYSWDKNFSNLSLPSKYGSSLQLSKQSFKRLKTFEITKHSFL